MKTHTLLSTLIVLTLLTSLFTFSSCSKDKDVKKPSLVGFWKGKYGSGATTYPTNLYAFLFRSDGTVRVFTNTDTTAAGTFKAEGTYVLSGSTVTTSYTYIAPGTGTNATSATVNPNFTFIEGTWGSGANTSNGGKFFISKE